MGACLRQALWVHCAFGSVDLRELRAARCTSCTPVRPSLVCFLGFAGLGWHGQTSRKPPWLVGLAVGGVSTAESPTYAFDALVSWFRDSLQKSVPSPSPSPKKVRNRSSSAAEESVMNGFEHEKLDVYQVAIEFLVVADEIAISLPKGRAYMA